MNIIIDKISYHYSPNTAFETCALDNVSFKIGDGEFIGVIGQTGSGKSTLIQHLNGLLKASSGKIYFDGEDIYDKDYNLTSLRNKVGMVFQYPEYQLFESTVLEDVKFGPKNQGLSEKEANIRAYEALEKMAFPRELIDQSPFDLSGGQMRLVAIAGVLAMKPQLLILDEPTAGLDPKSKENVLNILKSLHEDGVCTVMLISHNMDDVARYTNRVLAMKDGKLVFDGVPSEILSSIDFMKSIGLLAPDISYLIDSLNQIGLDIDTKALDTETVAQNIFKALKQND